MSECTQSRFKGTYDHKMDTKGRVAVPAEWRAEEGTALLLRESTREDLPILRCFPLEHLNFMISRIRENTNFNEAQKLALIGQLNESCVDVSINSQGKLLIPKKLAERSDFETDLVLAGRGPEFDIRSARHHGEIRRREQARLNELGADLGFL